MSKIFAGKFKKGDQLEKEYYRINTTDESVRDHHFNGLEIGDYVLPIKSASIEKLFKKLCKNKLYKSGKIT